MSIVYVTFVNYNCNLTLLKDRTDIKSRLYQGQKNYLAELPVKMNNKDRYKWSLQQVLRLEVKLSLLR